MQVFWGPSGLILLGAILAAIGALWSSQQQGNFEREMRQKNEQVAALIQKSLDEVTGGQSFPVIEYAPLVKLKNIGMNDGSSRMLNGNQLISTLIVDGDNPIECSGGQQFNKTGVDNYDKVHGTLETGKTTTDIQFAERRAAQHMPDVPQGKYFSGQRYEFGTKIILNPSETEWHFSSTISCRNGQFKQNTIVRRLVAPDAKSPHGVWGTWDYQVTQKVGDETVIRRPFER